MCCLTHANGVVVDVSEPLMVSMEFRSDQCALDCSAAVVLGFVGLLYLAKLQRVEQITRMFGH